MDKSSDTRHENLHEYSLEKKAKMSTLHAIALFLIMLVIENTLVKAVLLFCGWGWRIGGDVQVQGTPGLAVDVLNTAAWH